MGWDGMGQDRKKARERVRATRPAAASSSRPTIQKGILSWRLQKHSPAALRPLHPPPVALSMTIAVGSPLPEGSVWEMVYTDDGSGACPTGPQKVTVLDAVRGKKVVIFGVPGAFTPTCSVQLPGFIEKAADIKSKGVDEIWCLAVNDGFCMAAWGAQTGATGKVRMIADGSADYTRQLGLDVDLSSRGMGVRCRRFCMVVENGVVRSLFVEKPGAFEVSSAEYLLSNL